MAQLSTKIQAYVEAAGKTVDFTSDVFLQDDSDGNGPYIKEWNIDAWKTRIQAIKDTNPKS